MLKRDYVLRLIERMISVLTDAIGLTRTQDYEGGLRTIDRTMKEFFGWSSEFINAMPDDYLLDMMKHGEMLDVDRTIILANLVKGEGDIYAAMGEAFKSQHRYVKALNFFLEASLSGEKSSVPDEFNLTDGLVETLQAYQLSAETNRRLWRYFERKGAYARAEDILYELLENSDYNEETVANGLAFYQRLLARSDDQLEQGGLTCKEVKEGLEELRLHREG